MNKTFMFGEITGDILKCSFDVHNVLGGGFLEKVYENALVIELRKLGHKVTQQDSINVKYLDKYIGSYVSDVVVDDKVIIELKATDKVLDQYRFQLLNYLRGTGYEVGMVLCFGSEQVKFKRVVNSIDFDEIGVAKG